MVDSIEYELVNWEPREVWKCQGACKKYRHRKAVKGILPAVCCGVTAKLIDRYRQPKKFEVDAVIASLESRDPVLESLMAEMQAAALVFPEHDPEPTQQPTKDAYKS